MNVRAMIIDGQAEFRALLMHHLTTVWDDVVISAYDPVSSGHLPAEFSGAGNDFVIVGSEQGDREALSVLRQFKGVAGFPALLYFGEGGAEERRQVKKLGVDGVFQRDRVQHDALAETLNELLRARRNLGGRRSDTGAGEFQATSGPSIKGYSLRQRLAASEFSSVYLARSEATGAKVVLKVLNQVPDLEDAQDAFDRFLREYELIASLDHPGVIRIHDLGVSDDHAHIVMEYLSGGDLRQRMQAGVSEKDARSYLRQIAAALGKIHTVGILHRDLKPGNIMFRADGSLALIDFGLAKRLKLDVEITGTGEIFGTPYYMSPEQGHGDRVDMRSDIYSLGVIFFELLTGQKPYMGSSAMGIIYQHRNSPIPKLPKRVARYQSLIDRMMAKRVEDRLQIAAELDLWL